MKSLHAGSVVQNRAQGFFDTFVVVMALTALLTLTFSHANRSAPPAQQEMLSAMGIDSSTDVQYKDAHGDALTVDEFMEAIGAGQKFDMDEEPGKGYGDTAIKQQRRGTAYGHAGSSAEAGRCHS